MTMKPRCVSFIRGQVCFVDMVQTASRRATYDILRHYCQLEGSLDEIVHAIDMPENGIYVNSYSREGFDIFEWCLQPTEVRYLSLDQIQCS